MTNEKRYWNALRTIASMPLLEQDNMISANMRHIAREAIAVEETTVRYGCHCDLEPGANPDGCVLDYDHPEDCIHAPALVAANKGREACHEWREVTFERPNVEHQGLPKAVPLDGSVCHRRKNEDS